MQGIILYTVRKRCVRRHRVCLQSYKSVRAIWDRCRHERIFIAAFSLFQSGRRTLVCMGPSCTSQEIFNFHQDYEKHFGLELV